MQEAVRLEKSALWFSSSLIRSTIITSGELAQGKLSTLVYSEQFPWSSRLAFRRIGDISQLLRESFDRCPPRPLSENEAFTFPLGRAISLVVTHLRPPASIEADSVTGRRKGHKAKHHPSNCEAADQDIYISLSVSGEIFVTDRRESVSISATVCIDL